MRQLNYKPIRISSAVLYPYHCARSITEYVSWDTLCSIPLVTLFRAECTWPLLTGNFQKYPVLSFILYEGVRSRSEGAAQLHSAAFRGALRDYSSIPVKANESLRSVSAFPLTRSSPPPTADTHCDACQP